VLRKHLLTTCRAGLTRVTGEECDEATTAVDEVIPRKRKRRSRSALPVANTKAAQPSSGNEAGIDTPSTAKQPSEVIVTPEVFETAANGTNLPLSPELDNSFCRVNSPYPDFNAPFPSMQPMQTTGTGETLDDLFGWLFPNNNNPYTNTLAVNNVHQTLSATNSTSFSIPQQSCESDPQLDAIIDTMWSSSPMPEMQIQQSQRDIISTTATPAQPAIQPQKAIPFLAPTRPGPQQWTPPNWRPPDYWVAPSPRVLINEQSRAEMFAMFEVRICEGNSLTRAARYQAQAVGAAVHRRENATIF
jgi:hypothetical protein